MTATDGSVADSLSVISLSLDRAFDCDKDVALMVARYSGATLGLLAFTIVIIAGLFNSNPVNVTLSRSVFALFTFCLIGLVLGTAAQKVVSEHEKKRESEIRERYQDDLGQSSETDSDSTAAQEAAAPVQT